VKRTGLRQFSFSAPEFWPSVLFHPQQKQPRLTNQISRLVKRHVSLEFVAWVARGARFRFDSLPALDFGLRKCPFSASLLSLNLYPHPWQVPYIRQGVSSRRFCYSSYQEILRTRLVHRERFFPLLRLLFDTFGNQIRRICKKCNLILVRMVE